MLAFRTAYVITGEASAAEDATQTAFLKAWRSLDRFTLERVPSPESGAALAQPFRPWLLQIVANEARNRRRADLRHPTLELIEATERADVQLDSSPEEHALTREQQQAIVDALNALSSDDRTVITMRYLLDLSEKEMAATLQVPPGTVKSRLSRALRRARAVLESDDVERSGQDV